MLQKILVPTDFSQEASNAFAVAVNLARKTGASLKVLHIIEPPYTANFSAMGAYVPQPTVEDVYIIKLMEQSKRSMERLVNQSGLEDLQIEHEVDVDRVIHKIRRTVEEEGVDLVVMGSQGANGLDEMLIGSNTEKVVRLASCPVLTVKHRHENFDISNILFPTNFEDDLSPVMHRVRQMQELFRAQLHLLYVNTPGTFGSTRDIRNRMLDFAERFHLRNFTTNVWNDKSEEDGVLDFAEQINADLILMVTHGRTGLARLLSGSITEGLVNHTVRPVLSFSMKALEKGHREQF